MRIADVAREADSAVFAAAKAADSALEFLVAARVVVAEAMAAFWAVMVNARVDLAAEMAALEACTARSRLSW